MRAWMLPLSALLACTAAVAQAPENDTDDVIIYRCTDADGGLTLRDTPCDDTQAQQTRTMLRPQDAPPRAPAPAPEPAPAPAANEPQVVVVSAPQPMYECITPDGDRYTSDTSDTGDGNPRWVPLWTLGYPVGGGYRRPARPSAQRGITFVDDRMRMPPPANISIPPAYDRPQPSPGVLHGRPNRPRPHPPGYGYGGGGTWIRDECTRLPQGEVCDRLRDRRQEIRRRIFNAQESERNTLRGEERAISARLANDCGIR